MGVTRHFYIDLPHLTTFEWDTTWLASTIKLPEILPKFKLKSDFMASANLSWPHDHETALDLIQNLSNAWFLFVVLSKCVSALGRQLQFLGVILRFFQNE